jgi:S-adenosylmethionine synthetase
MRTARTLSPGQPDRTCDIVAESILDEYLRRDPETSARLRVMGGRGALFVSGVISTKADFDVGAIITRTAASLGVRGHMEPFVSIDAIPGSFLLEATRSNRPISVVGYASRETEERLPSHVVLSRRIAKSLEDLRQHDPEWFWLEPSFEVTITEKEKDSFRAYVNCAHGDVDLKDARDRIGKILNSKFQIPNSNLHINEHGSMPSNGLDQDVGASGLSEEPYGSAIPWLGSTIGLDLSNPSKFGAWLARGLAKRVLERSEAKAVMVQATYLPGDKEPSALRVRDERGNDLKQAGDGETMTYVHLTKYIRPGLSTNAAHWGFAGEVEMPWEAL